LKEFGGFCLNLRMESILLANGMAGLANGCDLNGFWLENGHVRATTKAVAYPRLNAVRMRNEDAFVGINILPFDVCTALF
jgi:hypothetical protein